MAYNPGKNIYRDLFHWYIYNLNYYFIVLETNDGDLRNNEMSLFRHLYNYHYAFRHGQLSF